MAYFRISDYYSCDEEKEDRDDEIYFWMVFGGD
jgi:hypothetical protein